MTASIRRIEDQHTDLERKIQKIEDRNLKQNSVDIYSISKQMEQQMAKQEAAQSENLKRCV